MLYLSRDTPRVLYFSYTQAIGGVLSVIIFIVLPGHLAWSDFL